MTLKPPVLEVRDLVVRHGEHFTLEVSSLAVQEGEVLAVIGPNGAGKSTLLQVIGLLHPPTGGEVFFKGEKVPWEADLLPWRRRSASVFQDPLLLQGTVFFNVALGLRFRRMPQPIIEERTGRWLERLKIAHLKGRLASTLSGGEAQRVALARAFVLEPELLLLDEPFAALDQPTREALLADLKQILFETRTTTVFVTHDRNEALALGDRVAVLIGGRILQLDVPEKVFAFPADLEVARFVGVETILSGWIVAEQEGTVLVQVDGAMVEVAGEGSVGERVLITLRPEDVVLATKEGARPSSARNRLLGKIARITPLGPFYRVTVECGAPLVALITRASALELALREGMEVVASFKATAAHLIRKPSPTL